MIIMYIDIMVGHTYPPLGSTDIYDQPQFYFFRGLLSQYRGCIIENYICNRINSIAKAAKISYVAIYLER